jgi:hypothetical protein
MFRKVGRCVVKREEDEGKVIRTTTRNKSVRGGGVFQGSQKGVVQPGIGG